MLHSPHAFTFQLFGNVYCVYTSNQLLYLAGASGTDVAPLNYFVVHSIKRAQLQLVLKQFQQINCFRLLARLRIIRIIQQTFRDKRR